MKRIIDEIDLQAIAEGKARQRICFALPAVLGSKIGGSKARYRNIKPATGINVNIKKEEKFGFGVR